MQFHLLFNPVVRLCAAIQEVNTACKGSYWNPENEICETKLEKVDKVIIIFLFSINYFFLMIHRAFHPSYPGT